MTKERKVSGFRCQGERAWGREQRAYGYKQRTEVASGRLRVEALEKKIGMTNDEQGMTLFVIRYSI